MTQSLLVLKYVHTLLTLHRDTVISCPLAFSCGFWWEANRSIKTFSPSTLRAFKFKIRIRWGKKNRVGWDISINRAASSLMKRIPAQWGNCNLQVIVAVNSISTYFGLADPLKTPPPCPDVNGNTRAHKSNTVVNQQATGGRSCFSNTVGKTPQNLREQGEFLQALVWFWDTRVQSYWKVLPFSLL